MVPLTLLVLTVLFAVQRFGTGGIGKAFGPITLVWFVVLVAARAAAHHRATRRCCGALTRAMRSASCLQHRWVAFVALGAVVLCVTGGEALYADMGHFGKLPIRIAWYGFVMPALVVNYFGQGALLLTHPRGGRESVLPDGAGLGAVPLVVLATAATVIASQALITAAFSVTKQAIQMGLLPRMRILHTSVRETGQIYVPFVNWGLYVFIVLAVRVFGSAAPGQRLRHRGDAGHDDHDRDDVLRHPLRLELPAGAVHRRDGLLLRHRHRLLRLQHAQAVRRRLVPDRDRRGMFTLMMTWKQGRELLREHLRGEAIDLRGFLEAVFVSPPARVSGTAVFLAAEPGLTPNALLHNLKHNKVLHEHEPLRDREAS